MWALEMLRYPKVSSSALADNRHRAMVVAMIAVRMVEMAVHKIVDVVTVRHCFMAAFRSMHMIGIVSLASMAWRASRGIGVVDF